MPVRIPPESELCFNKLLIINNLIKYNSLQTFAFWGLGTCISDDIMTRRGKRKRNCILLSYFPPHVQLVF